MRSAWGSFLGAPVLDFLFDPLGGLSQGVGG